MAQKIGLAILALLGFANCGIYAGGSGLHYYHQVDVNHGSEGASSSESHPVLGEKDVKLGYGILNFANTLGERHDNEEISRGHDQNFVILERNNGRNEVRSGNFGRKQHASGRGGLRRENDSNDHGDQSREKNSNGHRNERKSLRGRSQGRRQADSDKRPAEKVQIKVVSPPLVVVRSEQKSDAPKIVVSPKKPDTVYVPVFGKLSQQESNIGLQQASNIIVTAPLISTDKVDSHRVGYNQKVGKSNCPQCREDKEEAAKTKKSSEQAIQKNTDELTTNIKGPINRVEVDTVNTAPKHHHHKKHKRGENFSHDHVENDSHEDDSSSQSNSASHHSKQTRNVRYEGESINWKAVKSSLARGQARQNAPFVVGKVVINQQANSGYHK